MVWLAIRSESVQAFRQDVAIVLVVAHCGHRGAGFAHKGVAAIDHVVEGGTQIAELAMVAEALRARFKIARGQSLANLGGLAQRQRRCQQAIGRKAEPGERAGQTCDLQARRIDATMAAAAARSRAPQPTIQHRS
ncbi:MAG: hypothetical protein MZV49_18660 [Rhodopseudomonas palustris]|nr:hypothetical protein [Rhodopseudomonas palustris]